MITHDGNNLGRLVLRAYGLRAYAAAQPDGFVRCRALKRRYKVLRQIRRLLKSQLAEHEQKRVNL